jgi:azobenzene reductase
MLNVIINGSHRQTAQSRKVALYLAEAWKKLNPANESDVIHLTGNPLPLWDDDAWTGKSERNKMWEPYGARLAKAEVMTVVSPEWHGMAPSGLKNFFLYWSTKEVGHKPALIVTVSASRGGAYPVNELRTSGYKNAHVLYIPDHVIVREAEKMLNPESSGNDDDYLRRRIDFSLKILGDYGKAMTPVRQGITYPKEFVNGM